jgi:hypothetical protein
MELIEDILEVLEDYNKEDVESIYNRYYHNPYYEKK